MRISKIYYIASDANKTAEKALFGSIGIQLVAGQAMEIAATGKSLAKQTKEVYENLQNLEF